MPITVGIGAGEYPPVVQYVINGEPADDLTFNRPNEDLSARTDAIKACLDAFPITEVVGLEAALQGASPLHANLGQLTSLDYAANPSKIFAISALGVAELIDNTLQGENNTATTIGSGAISTVAGKVGLDLQFKSITAGENMSISQTADEITFTSAPGEIGRLTKLVKNTTGAPIPAKTPVSWLDDGTMQLADANIVNLSDFCGVTISEIPNGAFGLVIKIGNVPGALTGLGATVGQYVYMGETPGTYSLTPPPFAGENSEIILGRAEPPDGVATATADDLFLQPAVITEGGSL